MSASGQGGDAVRQVEHWYEHFIDSFVEEGRSRPTTPSGAAPSRPAMIDGTVLAYAHEQAWRHAVVRARKSTSDEHWAELTVAHESAAYEHLLTWTATKYAVPESDILESQTVRGYRHHPR